MASKKPAAPATKSKAAKKPEAPKIPMHGIVQGRAEPLSETLIPKTKTATKQQVVSDLRRLAEANPTIAISRNFYRVHGQYAESAWNQYFGTFEEFKRQAGLKLTRQQHAVERAVAKHASVDHYRQLNEERRSYADKYQRPGKGRFRTYVIASDLHDEEMAVSYTHLTLPTKA